MKPNILILEPDDYSETAIELFKRIGNVRFNFDDEDFESWNDTHILVCRLGYYLDDSFLKQFHKLRAIACPTTGLNHIDLQYCNKNEIAIISLKGETSFLNTIRSTSELTFALILNLVKNVRPSSIDVIENGNWLRNSFKGRELQEMTLGLIGFGRVGKHVAEYASAFQMKVIAHDPFIKKKDRCSNSPLFTSLDDLFKNSDIVSLHADYRADNCKMVTARQFKKMKRGSYFVNTSRGEMVSEKDLIWALKEGILSGVAIDVLSEENAIVSFSDHPLIKFSKIHPNVIITPHIGGCTRDAMRKTEIFIANRVIDFFKPIAIS